jgi:hypothetical protein
MFNNVIIKNVLSKNSIESILNDVDFYMNSLESTEQPFDVNDPKTSGKTTKILRKFLGRISIHHLPLSDNVIKELTEAVHNAGFTDYNYSPDTTYIEYGNVYGNPKLPPHNDVEAIDHILIDYHLDSNVDWEVEINKKPFLLKNNEILIFNGVLQEHSRPIIKMKDKDFVKVLLIRFNKKGNI